MNPAKGKRVRGGIACSARAGGFLPVLAVTAGLCGLEGCGEGVPWNPGPPQDHLAIPLSDIQFDDCAAGVADALRRWPVVDRTDAPILLAGPRWVNQTSLPVQNGEAFARRLADAVNLRTGAKVRIVSPAAIGCHYATEIALREGKDSRDRPVAILAFRVLRPGLSVPLLEEVFTVGNLSSTDSPTVAHPPTGGSAAIATAVPYHTIRFERGQVHFDTAATHARLAILGERAWREGAGELHVELRLMSRSAETALVVSACGIDQAGSRQPEPKHWSLRLSSFQPATLTLVLPASAHSYAVDLALR